MINVLYYYYYLFYTKIIPDSQPHSTVIFTLGFSLGLILVGIINLLISITIGKSLNKWEMIIIDLFMMFVLYLIYYRTGKGKKIVTIHKPKILNSNVLSIIMTAVFFLTAMFGLFFVPTLVRDILNN